MAQPIRSNRLPHDATNAYTASPTLWEDYQPRVLGDIGIIERENIVPGYVPSSAITRQHYDPSAERIPDPERHKITFGMMLPLIDMLLHLGVPLHRRFVQSVLTYQFRYSPSLVSRMIKAAPFIDRHRITLHEFTVDGEPNQVLFLGDVDRSQMINISELIRHRQKFIRPEIVGPIGEQFVRSCLVHTDRYTGVTQAKKLGHVRDENNKNAVDLMATDEQTGIEYAISVKNVNEWLFPGKPSIKDAWNKAEAHGAQPWLIAPFATDAARQRCASNPKIPIRLTAIGAQILPKVIDGRQISVVLRELAPLIGPQPFILHGERFDPSTVPAEFMNAL